jgi:HEAT repeat protein
LLAAQHAGKDGHAVLLALAADTQLDRSLRVQAVESLGRHPVPAVDGLRAVLVSAHPPELTVAALAVIGWSDDATLREAVLSCARSEHDSVRAEAARVLGRLAHPQAEPILIQLLSDAASDVQHASAEALGLFGSVAAVEPLLPLAETLVRPRLRQAARGAIGRIQSRLGDVEAGRLSLSDPRDLAGAVDVVDTSALRVGEVSLAEEPVAPVRQKADPGGA